MKSDIEIAREAKMLPITEVAKRAGIEEDYLELYGKYKAKISLDILKGLKNKKDGKLIMVTAITPTPAGEGKTTTTIGLTMALNRLGKNAALTIREPSLGPCFGIKGGAAGGGYSQVVPMEDVNLHFTGDIHAVSAAHNLLAAMVDNSLHQGNPLDMDSRAILWGRVMDMNERALRHIIIGLGGKTGGVPRESRFDISTSSEVMAILGLSNDLMELREKLGNIIVAYNRKGDFIRAKDVKAHGAMAALLKDAIKPNLVQTLENTPAFVHGGPFANIAHGTNTIIATKLALKLFDYVVVETGFGSDLGGEKFFDIVTRAAGFKTSVVVVVATVRALKMHGGMPLSELKKEDLGALKEGLGNLKKHVENMKMFGVPVVVALNRFSTDTDKELEIVTEAAKEWGVEVALNEAWARGGEGAIELANEVIKVAESDYELKYLYDINAPIKEKIHAIATKMYGADGVRYLKAADRMIANLEEKGMGNLPICMAKTQLSLSDDPTLKGRPLGFEVEIREVRISAGAGFIVPIAGTIMTLPGLPKHPAAENIDIDADGNITGLF